MTPCELYLENVVSMSVQEGMDTAFGAARTKKGMFRTVSQLYKVQYLMCSANTGRKEGRKQNETEKNR